MTYLPPVTAHAVLRYLTRIEGVDLRPHVNRLGREAGNWRLARAAAASIGVDVIEIQKRICPEHLAAAVKGGVERIRRPGIVLYCKGGLVTTVMDEIHKGGHIKNMSRREIKRRNQQADRRSR